MSLAIARTYDRADNIDYLSKLKERGAWARTFGFGSVSTRLGVIFAARLLIGDFYAVKLTIAFSADLCFNLNVNIANISGGQHEPVK